MSHKFDLLSSPSLQQMVILILIYCTLYIFVYDNIYKIYNKSTCMVSHSLKGLYVFTRNFKSYIHHNQRVACRIYKDTPLNLYLRNIDGYIIVFLPEISFNSVSFHLSLCCSICKLFFSKYPSRKIINE